MNAMHKKTGVIVISILVSFSFAVITVPPKNTAQQKNTAPLVKIVTPKNDARVESNTIINYSITVSDKEDGESKYDEINVKEVLLQVKYIAGQSAVTPDFKKRIPADAPGLDAMRTSNCFNCHAFNANSIGPSFNDINKKYAFTNTNTALLVKHVREGSTGIWGKMSMPTHTELSRQETQDMVRWILQNRATPGNSYYTGLEGSFRLQPGAPSKPGGAYMLIASYTDHGLKNDSLHRIKGRDIVVIRPK